MHGSKKAKFANAKQAKQIYQYNIKKTVQSQCSDIAEYNKSRRQKQLTPNNIPAGRYYH